MPLRAADPAHLRAALDAGLPPALAYVLHDAVALGAARGTPLYLVGGAVRDLLLGRPALDFDLVLPGDAAALARAVAARQGLEVTQHDAFGTATIKIPDAGATGLHGLDFVTARRETYPAPGHLPVVTPAGLDADLARRDFTINALALALDPAAPALIDPHGGQADLIAGLIRALHAGSFRDDPTRILRAVRYEQRFGFAIEPETRAWIADALTQGLLDTLSPARLRREFERTLAETDPVPALTRLQELGVLATIDPALTWNAAWAADLACAADPGLRLLLLVARCPPEARPRLAARLDLPPRPLEEWTQLEAQAAGLAAARPSQAAALLRPLDLRALDLARCLAPPPVAAVIARYQAEWQHVKPALTGGDLQARGLPPGPQYRPLLAALRDARLDGRVTSRDDELALLQELLRET